MIFLIISNAMPVIKEEAENWSIRPKFKEAWRDNQIFLIKIFFLLRIDSLESVCKLNILYVSILVTL